MTPPRLKGRTFRAMSNSAHGQSGSATEMEFTGDDDYVTATYAGGGVRLGQVLARRTDDDALDMHYHAGSTSGQIPRRSWPRDVRGRLARQDAHVHRVAVAHRGPLHRPFRVGRGLTAGTVRERRPAASP